MATAKKGSPFEKGTVPLKAEPMPKETAAVAATPSRVPMVEVQAVEEPEPLNPAARAAMAQAEAFPEGTEQKPRAAGARIPFGMIRSRFPELPPRPGFHRRWCNDTDQRLQRYIMAGYAHVLDDKGEPWSIPGGTTKDGKTFRIYALEQPLEYYEEDFEAKQDRLDATDRNIYGGVHNLQPGDNRYVPAANPIKFGVQTGPGADKR